LRQDKNNILKNEEVSDFDDFKFFSANSKINNKINEHNFRDSSYKKIKDLKINLLSI
jgi:hypothetical protein